MAELLPGISGFGVPALIYFLVVITVVVFAHELGHYLAARGCGVTVEEFAVGFGPKLVSFRDRTNTEWTFRWVPLGGYVRMPDGVFYHRSVTEEGSTEVNEGQGGILAPLRHRAIIAAGGPVASVVFGILIFAGMMMASGIVTERAVIGELKELPDASYELEEGDRILSVNGFEIDGFASLFSAIIEITPVDPTVYRVQRGDESLVLLGPPLHPPLIDAVYPGSAAFDAGLEAGDVIVSIDDEPVGSFADVVSRVGDSNGREMRFEIWRQGEVFETYLAGRMTDFGLPGEMEQKVMIGISGGLFFAPETYTPGPISALGYGALQAWRIISGSFIALYEIVASRISTCNLLGPVGIAEVSGDVASQGLSDFIYFIGVLSVAIGVFQLLPIPVLDGGHLAFMACEAISGRPIRSRILRWSFGIGLILMLALLGFTLVNDLTCP